MPEQVAVQDWLHAGYDQFCWFSVQVLILLVRLQSNYDKMKSEVPKYKMITPSILADRLRVRAMYWVKQPLSLGLTVYCDKFCCTAS